MSAELLVFPDIEAVLVKHLRAKLTERGDTAHVSTIVPADRPDRLVKVARTGGPQRSMTMDAPQVTVQCWASGEVDAHDLASLAHAIVAAMPREESIEGAVIYHYIETSGPMFFPDLESQIPRYQFTGQLLVRAVAI